MRTVRLVPLAIATLALTACSQSQDVTAPTFRSPVASLQTSNGQAGKSDVCHVNGKGGFQMLSVSNNAIAAHLQHGDHLPVASAFVLPAGTTFSASNTWADRGPISNAFDGNTSTEWNAGGGPVQWIEVNFGSPQVLTGMSALIDQVPDGNTVHDVTIDGLPSFSWTGYTTTGQTLSHAFASPQTAQTVRITTTSSDSWVAWLEIQFTGAPGC